MRRPRALADRCKAVLLDDDGLTYAAIGAKIGMREQTVLKWRTRFLAHRLAGLMVKTGVVIGECYKRHRHQEFIKFLNTIDEVVRSTEPAGTSIHLLLDNSATHKTPAVQRWLRKHPEYHLHFTPTSASWLNQVERVFADLTERQLRRGVFTSVAALEKAALAYLDARNDNATPFVWTADASTILGRVARNRATISKSGH